MALVNLGRPADAVPQFENALRIDPQSDDSEGIYLYLGRAKLQLGKPVEAAQALEKVLAINAGNAEARYVLGMARIAQGDYSRRARNAEPALRAAPSAERLLRPRARLPRPEAQGRGRRRHRHRHQARPGQSQHPPVAGEDPGDAVAAMRILHVGKYFAPVSGGMERFLGDLAEAQRAAGHDVSVLVHGHGEPVPSDPPWLMRCPVWFRLVFAPISPAFPFWLRRAIAREAPDVLHLHLPNPSAFWALAVPAARRIPWVVHWHSDVEPSRFRLSLRLAYPFYRDLRARRAGARREHRGHLAALPRDEPSPAALARTSARWCRWDSRPAGFPT